MQKEKDRLVTLTDDLPETEGFPLHTCNWCVGSGREGTKAVLAVEHTGKIHRFYGVCSNHAEILSLHQDQKGV